MRRSTLLSLPFLVALTCPCAQLSAQRPAAALPAASSGTDSARLTVLRACARVQCALTLERGTVNGTRLRIGNSETLVPVGMTGRGVYRRLVAVPAAVPEATAGRDALRQNTLITVAALAASSLIWLRLKPPFDAGVVSKRLGIVGAIGIASIYQWQRNARSADTHFEKAVDLYNRELPP